MRQHLLCWPAIFLTASFRALGGECYDADPPVCLEPCPCAESCYFDEDCTEGQICVPDCLPSICWCDTEEPPGWNITLDCAGRCIVPPVPSGPPTYTIVELPAPYFEAHANAINNWGQVGGEADFREAGGRSHACLWEGEAAVDLTPTMVATSSSARDINEHGQVLINADFGLDHGAYHWHQGILTELPRFYDLGNAKAYAINDSGQIVGQSTVRNVGEHACLWDTGIIIDLQQELGTDFYPLDINDRGVMAGSVRTIVGWRAAFLEGSLLTDLGTLGGTESGASMINEYGDVLGCSRRSGDDECVDTLWHATGVIDLSVVTDHPVVRYAYPPKSMNDCGDVLLHGDPPSRGTDFFLYSRERGLRPIRGITRPTTEWSELLPWGLNDRGQIVGFGTKYGSGRSRAFVMSPIVGDMDTDGDVDLDDFAQVQTGFTGTQEPDVPGCVRADWDGDADVDLSDFSVFRESIAGPQ